MKILIVDDSAAVRRVIRKKLEDGGYEVEEAEDGADALRRIALSHGDIDLITLDLEMPVMDGFRTCAELNKERYKSVFSRRGRKIPILFVTSRDSLDIRKKGFELGAADFIAGKDFIEEEILDRVNKILKPSGKLRGLTALVAEDSRTYRAILVETLRAEGVEVLEADNGRQAYDIISSDPEAVDMLITDLEMPEMNGIFLINRIRTELGMKEIPIIILSAIGEKVTLLDLFKCGASDYLTKPFIKEELLARLRVHLERVLMTRKLKSNLLEMKKMNGQLEENRNAIEKQSRERKELLHVLCHDLANPLSSIIGVMDLIEVMPQYTTLKDEAVKVAYKGLDIIELVREMRAIEDNKATLKLENINLKESVTESLMILRKKFENKNITPDVDIPGDIIISAEKISLVNSVINNLLTNALKFSNEGSVIKINVENNSAGFICLAVSDTGVGMSPRLQKDIFNANKATNRTGTAGEAGTGFGMPLVKKFMNAYGGEITVESKAREQFPGEHGTKVKLFFKPGQDGG